MKKNLQLAADKVIQLIIVLAIVCVPLFYWIGKGEGYFFSIYDVYKEVLVQSAAVLLLAAYALKLWCSENVSFRKVPLWLPFIGFFIILLISFTQMINPYEGFVFLKRWIAHYIIVFVVAHHLRTREQLGYYINWIIVMGVLMSVYALIQIWGYDFPFLVQNFVGNATDGNPNFTGEYIGMLFPLALWRGIAFAGKKRAFYYYAAAVVMGFFILLNKTKEVWIGLSLSTITVMIYALVMYATNTFSLGLSREQKTLFRTIVRITAGMVIAVFAFSLLTYLPVLRKNHVIRKYNDIIHGFISEFAQFRTATLLFTPQDKIPDDEIHRGDTTMQRIIIWQNTLKLIRAHPLLGVGLGNFKIAYQPYRTRREQKATGPDVFVRRSHNEYLQLLAELGPFGLLLFFMIQFSLYLMAHRLVTCSSAFRVQATSIGFMMSFMTMFGMAPFGFPLQTPNPFFTLWLLVGLFAGYYWLVWYEEGVRFETPKFLSYMRTFALERPWARGLVKPFEAVEIVPENGSPKKKKKQAIDTADGVYSVSQRIRPFLIPLYILVIAAGIFLHPWIWEPAQAFYYRQFGQALQRMGLHKKAAILFKKSLTYEPLSWESHFLLGNEYAAMNEFDDAVREQEFSLKLNPYHAKAHYNLGNTLNKMNRFDEAIKHYELACRYDNMLHQAYCNLGAMYFQTKQYEKSIAAYKESLRVNPNFFSAYYNIAYALIGLGRIREGLPYLQRAQQMQPRNEKVVKLEKRVRAIIEQARKK